VVVLSKSPVLSKSGVLSKSPELSKSEVLSKSGVLSKSSVNLSLKLFHMRYIILLSFLFIAFSGFAQGPSTPDKIYDDLFVDIQMAKIYPDGKSFVDLVPKRSPQAIMAEYKKIKKAPSVDFSLKKFAEDNFEMPASQQLNYVTREKDVVSHIQSLWAVLKRNPDKPIEGSSLLPLPNPYIVPGGRFREVYYWDSYFTMLGLKESGEIKTIEDMVNNFAYMINTFGHIPNGNRTYYLSRSQPPFFALMVELLAEIKGDKIYETYLPALEKEYQYWMMGSEKIAVGAANQRVVKLADGTILNRYWDDLDIPRQESYREDVETAEKAAKSFLSPKEFKNEKQKEKAVDQFKSEIFRHLRSGAASGWDFSSRWFADRKNIITIQTTQFLPVDLNCLLYQLELTIKKAYTKITSSKSDVTARNIALAGQYDNRAKDRKKAIEQYCWNESAGIYADYNFVSQKVNDQVNMSGMFPLFFQVADRARAEKEQKAVIRDLLKDGGFLTTPEYTGQQWDAPNGWAPLQWIAIIGLEKYGYFEESRQSAERWVKLNKTVFDRTGKLMEKYNVSDLKLDAGGGEYPSQDGFGWTNGVLLALIKKYNL
jgi:alpha,alpha-trehalase